MSKRNVSVSSGIIYEKFDWSSWLRVPKHSQVPRTSYLDVRELTIDTKSLGVARTKRPSIQEMLAKM